MVENNNEEVINEDIDSVQPISSPTTQTIDEDPADVLIPTPEVEDINNEEPLLSNDQTNTDEVSDIQNEDDPINSSSENLVGDQIQTDINIPPITDKILPTETTDDSTRTVSVSTPDYSYLYNDAVTEPFGSIGTANEYAKGSSNVVINKVSEDQAEIDALSSRKRADYTNSKIFNDYTSSVVQNGTPTLYGLNDNTLNKFITDIPKYTSPDTKITDKTFEDAATNYLAANNIPDEDGTLSKTLATNAKYITFSYVKPGDNFDILGEGSEALTQINDIRKGAEDSYLGNSTIKQIEGLVDISFDDVPIYDFISKNNKNTDNILATVGNQLGYVDLSQDDLVIQAQVDNFRNRLENIFDRRKNPFKTEDGKDKPFTGNDWNNYQRDRYSSVAEDDINRLKTNYESSRFYNLTEDDDLGSISRGSTSADANFNRGKTISLTKSVSDGTLFLSLADDEPKQAILDAAKKSGNFRDVNYKDVLSPYYTAEEISKLIPMIYSDDAMPNQFDEAGLTDAASRTVKSFTESNSYKTNITNRADNIINTLDEFTPEVKTKLYELVNSYNGEANTPALVNQIYSKAVGITGNIQATETLKELGFFSGDIEKIEGDVLTGFSDQTFTTVRDHYDLSKYRYTGFTPSSLSDKINDKDFDSGVKGYYILSQADDQFEGLSLPFISKNFSDGIKLRGNKISELKNTIYDLDERSILPTETNKFNELVNTFRTFSKDNSISLSERNKILREQGLPTYTKLVNSDLDQKIYEYANAIDDVSSVVESGSKDAHESYMKTLTTYQRQLLDSSSEYTDAQIKLIKDSDYQQQQEANRLVASEPGKLATLTSTLGEGVGAIYSGMANPISDHPVEFVGGLVGATAITIASGGAGAPTYGSVLGIVAGGAVGGIVGGTNVTYDSVYLGEVSDRTTKLMNEDLGSDVVANMSTEEVSDWLLSHPEEYGDILRQSRAIASANVESNTLLSAIPIVPISYAKGSVTSTIKAVANESSQVGKLLTKDAGSVLNPLVSSSTKELLSKSALNYSAVTAGDYLINLHAYNEQDGFADKQQLFIESAMSTGISFAFDAGTSLGTEVYGRAFTRLKDVNPSAAKVLENTTKIADNYKKVDELDINSLKSTVKKYGIASLDNTIEEIETARKSNDRLTQLADKLYTQSNERTKLDVDVESINRDVDVLGLSDDIKTKALAYRNEPNNVTLKTDLINSIYDSLPQNQNAVMVRGSEYNLEKISKLQSDLLNRSSQLTEPQRLAKVSEIESSATEVINNIISGRASVEDLASVPRIREVFNSLSNQEGLTVDPKLINKINSKSFNNGYKKSKTKLVNQHKNILNQIEQSKKLVSAEILQSTQNNLRSKYQIDNAVDISKELKTRSASLSKQIKDSERSLVFLQNLKTDSDAALVNGISDNVSKAKAIDELKIKTGNLRKEIEVINNDLDKLNNDIINTATEVSKQKRSDLNKRDKLYQKILTISEAKKVLTPRSRAAELRRIQTRISELETGNNLYHEVKGTLDNAIQTIDDNASVIATRLKEIFKKTTPVPKVLPPSYREFIADVKARRTYSPQIIRSRGMNTALSAVEHDLRMIDQGTYTPDARQTDFTKQQIESLRRTTERLRDIQKADANLRASRDIDTIGITSKQLNEVISNINDRVSNVDKVIHDELDTILINYSLNKARDEGLEVGDNLSTSIDDVINDVFGDIDGELSAYRARQVELNKQLQSLSTDFKNINLTTKTIKEINQLAEQLDEIPVYSPHVKGKVVIQSLIAAKYGFLSPDMLDNLVAVGVNPPQRRALSTTEYLDYLNTVREDLNNIEYTSNLPLESIRQKILETPLEDFSDIEVTNVFGGAVRESTINKNNRVKEIMDSEGTSPTLRSLVDDSYDGTNLTTNNEVLLRRSLGSEYDNAINPDNNEMDYNALAKLSELKILNNLVGGDERVSSFISNIADYVVNAAVQYDRTVSDLASRRSELNVEFSNALNTTIFTDALIRDALEDINTSNNIDTGSGIATDSKFKQANEEAKAVSDFFTANRDNKLIGIDKSPNNTWGRIKNAIPRIINTLDYIGLIPKNDTISDIAQRYAGTKDFHSGIADGVFKDLTRIAKKFKTDNITQLDTLAKWLRQPNDIDAPNKITDADLIQDIITTEMTTRYGEDWRATTTPAQQEPVNLLATELFGNISSYTENIKAVNSQIKRRWDAELEDPDLFGLMVTDLDQAITKSRGPAEGKSILRDQLRSWVAEPDRTFTATLSDGEITATGRELVIKQYKLTNPTYAKLVDGSYVRQSYIAFDDHPRFASKFGVDGVHPQTKQAADIYTDAVTALGNDKLKNAGFDLGVINSKMLKQDDGTYILEVKYQDPDITKLSEIKKGKVKIEYTYDERSKTVTSKIINDSDNPIPVGMIDKLTTSLSDSTNYITSLVTRREVGMSEQEAIFNFNEFMSTPAKNHRSTQLPQELKDYLLPVNDVADILAESMVRLGTQMAGLEFRSGIRAMVNSGNFDSILRRASPDEVNPTWVPIKEMNNALFTPSREALDSLPTYYAPDYVAKSLEASYFELVSTSNSVYRGWLHISNIIRANKIALSAPIFAMNMAEMSINTTIAATTSKIAGIFHRDNISFHKMIAGSKDKTGIKVIRDGKEYELSYKDLKTNFKKSGLYDQNIYTKPSSTGVDTFGGRREYTEYTNLEAQNALRDTFKSFKKVSDNTLGKLVRGSYAGITKFENTYKNVMWFDNFMHQLRKTGNESEAIGFANVQTRKLTMNLGSSSRVSQAFSKFRLFGVFVPLLAESTKVSANFGIEISKAALRGDYELATKYASQFVAASFVPMLTTIGFTSLIQATMASMNGFKSTGDFDDESESFLHQVGLDGKRPLTTNQVTGGLDGQLVSFDKARASTNFVMATAVDSAMRVKDGKTSLEDEFKEVSSVFESFLLTRGLEAGILIDSTKMFMKESANEADYDASDYANKLFVPTGARNLWNTLTDGDAYYRLDKGRNKEINKVSRNLGSILPIYSYDIGVSVKAAVYNKMSRYEDEANVEISKLTSVNNMNRILALDPVDQQKEFKEIAERVVTITNDMKTYGQDFRAGLTHLIENQRDMMGPENFDKLYPSGVEGKVDSILFGADYVDNGNRAKVAYNGIPSGWQKYFKDGVEDDFDLVPAKIDVTYDSRKGKYTIEKPPRGISNLTYTTDGGDSANNMAKVLYQLNNSLKRTYTESTKDQE